MDITGKFSSALYDLKHALEFQDKAAVDSFYYAGIAKSFEVCFEYSWKYLRQLVTADGLEAKSPREAIKVAGSLGYLDDAEKWLGFLEDRNQAVHDYVGVPQRDYLKTIIEFYAAARKLLEKPAPEH